MTHAQALATDAYGPPDPLDPAEDQWSLARDLYAAGQTGQAVCAALGIRSSTFWRRAAKEGWLRRDQPNAFYTPGPLDLSAPVDDHDAAIDKAWRRVCAALDDGRSGEAARWIRVHSALLSQIDARRERDRRDDRHEIDKVIWTAKGITARANLEIARLKPGARALDDALEKVESTLTDSHSPDTPSTPLDPNVPGLTRAERRRRQKYLTKSR